MKGGEHRRACSTRAAEQTQNSLAHFICGFISEGDGQNGRPGHAMILDEVRDAMRDHASFSAAGAGKQQQRTFNVLNGFALLRI